jgi:N-acyl-D-aspartate/D-glutamate deacylase
VSAAGGTGREATIPSWAFEGGIDSLKARLANPATRARLKNEQKTGSPGWWNIVEAAGGWDGVVLVNARNPENAKYERKSLSEIARLMNKEPADAAMDLVVQGTGRVMAIYHMMGEPDIETALKFPWTSIGSDAGAIMTLGQPDQTGLPHPRSFGNATRVIAEYVKKRMIKEGQWADVTIFDLDALQDKATYDDPMAFPTGIEYVLVNGVVTIDHDKHTGAKAGKVLYGPGK